MSRLSISQFENFFRYYKALPHQREALETLWKAIPVTLLENDATWVEQYRSQKASRAQSRTSERGIDLIKDFEGLVLHSYYCASGVLTIGYGHTGCDVYSGKEITEDEAVELLRKDLWRFEDAVSGLITVPLSQGEYDALVSFAFNCGEGALEHSTLRRRLNSGDEKRPVFLEELPKWVNGPNGPLPGLVRRREAEIQLALG